MKRERNCGTVRSLEGDEKVIINSMQEKTNRVGLTGFSKEHNLYCFNDD